MNSEPDAVASVPTAPRPRVVHPPEGPGGEWHLGLPLDHPSYPDPSNIWPPVASPPAVMTTSAVPAPVTPASIGRPAPVQAATVHLAAVPRAGVVPPTSPRPRGLTPAAAAAGRAGEPSVLDRFERLRQLTGTVAHDINNLLLVIRNYADFVADALDEGQGHGTGAAAPAGAGYGGAAASQLDDRGVPGGVPGGCDAIRRDVAQIQRAGERAAELAAELLAAVRRQPVLAGPIDVNAVVRETVAMLRRPLGERIDLRIELDDTLWRVRADPARLERAIVNLAMNARDAMPRGGTLTVTTGNLVLRDGHELPTDALPPAPAGFGGGAPVWYPGPPRHLAGPPQVEAEPPGRRHVGIWVSDTGAGMTPATRARAFEPFFTTKPADRGTGLGLAVVREVVTDAGGEVELRSTVGVGTTVSLLLPAADQSTPTPGISGTDGPWAHRPRPDAPPTDGPRVDAPRPDTSRPDTPRTAGLRADGGASTRPSAVRRPHGQPPTAISRAPRS
jgi:signal transduction histidine kinase